jgi:hypothetical protein
MCIQKRIRVRELWKTLTHFGDHVITLCFKMRVWLSQVQVRSKLNWLRTSTLTDSLRDVLRLESS